MKLNLNQVSNSLDDSREMVGEDSRNMETVPGKSGAESPSMESEDVKRGLVPVLCEENPDANAEEFFESPLGLAGQALRLKGVGRSNIKAILTVVMGLTSAQSADPLAIGITEEETGGISALDLAISLTKKSKKFEFSELDSRKLFASGSHLKGSAIVCFDSAILRKTLINVFLLMERSLAVNFAGVKVNGSADLEIQKIQGPISWVTIAKDPSDPFLAHPFVLKVHLTADADGKRERILKFATQTGARDQEEFDVLSGYTSTVFARAKDVPVEIPYGAQLYDALDSSVPNSEIKVDLIFRALRNVVRINNAVFPSEVERFAETIGVNHESLKKFLAAKGASEQKLLPFNNDGINDDHKTDAPVLVAQRRDYYFLWCLLDGNVSTNESELSESQTRVFNAVKDLNLHYLEGATFIDFDKEGPSEILKALSHNTRAWADLNAIKAKIDAGGETMHQSKIYRELKKPCNDGYINSKQDPSVKHNKLIYSINFWSAESGLQLPHPSGIGESEGPLLVVNPISGEKVTIP